MSEIDFETGGPIWGVEIEHHNPGASPVWGRVFNAPDEEAAKRKGLALFEADGLSIVLIDKIEIWELTIPKGDEDG